MSRALAEDWGIEEGASAAIREQVLNVAFPRGQIRLHLTPLANHYGAGKPSAPHDSHLTLCLLAFDGWKKLKSSKPGPVTDDKEMLSPGDRLLAIDGNHVLDASFHDIIQQLTQKPTGETDEPSPSDQAREAEGAGSSDVKSRLFHLQFIKPANTQTVVLDEALHEINAWFRPANPCFYGKRLSVLFKINVYRGGVCKEACFRSSLCFSRSGER